MQTITGNTKTVRAHTLSGVDGMGNRFQIDFSKPVLNKEGICVPIRIGGELEPTYLIVLDLKQLNELARPVPTSGFDMYHGYEYPGFLGNVTRDSNISSIIRENTWKDQFERVMDTIEESDHTPERELKFSDQYEDTEDDPYISNTTKFLRFGKIEKEL